jgi:adenine deaminase
MFGVMTDRTLADIAGDQIRFGELMKERGYPYGSLMYTMQFLACDFLPEVRLTSAGLVNIRTAEVLAPVRPL